jgi:O-antigen/teichoic acid export membrane protein
MIRRLASDTVVYGLGQVSQQLLAFITLPIFARILSPADFGVLETLATVTAVIGLVASLQFDSAMQRRYFDYPAEATDERRRVIVTAMLSVLAWDLLLFAAVTPFGGPIMRHLQIDDGGTLLMLALAPQFLTIPLTLCREVLRLQRRPWAYTLTALANSGLWLVCGLFFVTYRHAGVPGYLWASALAVILTLPLAGWLIRHELRARFSAVDFKAMLHFALPLIPAGATMWLLSLADRLILNQWVDLAALGHYGIGQKMTRLITLLFMAFGTAWSPFIYALYAEDPQREKQVRATISPIYFAVLAFAGVLMTGLAPEIIHLVVSDAFLPAVAVVGPLSLGLIGSGLSQLLCTGISLSKQTGYFALHMGICSLITVMMNLLLVPRWGITGSAWASAAGFATLNVLYYHTGQRVYPTPYPLFRLLTMALLTIATSCLLSATPGLAWRLMTIAGFLPAAVLLGAVDRQQTMTWIRLGRERFRLRGQT